MWTDYSEAFAFLGNSLLDTMSHTSDVGLDPDFWARFPNFDSPRVKEALAGCADWARKAQTEEDPRTAASVEYTRLFIGPPRPEAAPWETYYRTEGTNFGFGQATFEMQELLRAAGLQVENDNNQYADHIGIELLYLSVLCGRMADAGTGGDGGEANAAGLDAIVSFAREHPLAWVGKLREKVEERCPQGYISHLLALAEALLVTLADLA